MPDSVFRKVCCKGLNEIFNLNKGNSVLDDDIIIFFWGGGLLLQ